MEEFFSQQKQTIYSFLKQFLASKDKELEQVNDFGPDVIKRLIHFLKNGKMIRGGLVILAHEMYGGTYQDDAIRLAAAMEIFHSSFLIHDDIIDRDTLRRGEKTITHQYKLVGKQQKFSDSEHFGNSLAICLGDISIFLGFELLFHLKSANTVKSLLLRLCSTELIKVGLGQMQDAHFSFQKESPNEDEILTMYRYKTARYTFSLPLMLGAILAKQSQSTRSTLEKLGESMGILFQLKDDELGIFGDEQETGKPIGSDIREGKKTVLLSLLEQKDIQHSDVATIQSLLETRGIRQEVNKLMQKYYKEAQNAIVQLDIPPFYKDIFISLLNYSLHRKK